MGRAAEMAKNALAGIASAVGLAKIAQMSDEYSKLTAQLRLATDSTSEYAQAYADVKRIANTSQSDLAATGSLYASLARATKDLGTSQKGVADITEAVNLGLKISGAGAQESAGAILQLSQAFAAGALRGDEFNSVAESAPRLMKALADNIGVPVGALRTMAEQGKLTADVVAKALPQALVQLRGEAGQIQTIAGSFVVLKNSVLEFTGVQAQSSGAVTVLTSGINLLANNLNVLAGAAATVAAVKLGNWLNGTISSATSAFTANRQLAASTIATAEANATATAQASLLANARLAEVRAATLAASGEVQLALTTNALIPAQARAAAAAEAHAVAMGQLTVAQRTAALGATAASRIIGGLGGPLGALITVLGLAATAWSWYKEKQDEATRKAQEDVGQSTNEIVDNLKQQNEQMRQRIQLAQRYGDIDAAQDSPALQRMAELQQKINDLKAQGAGISSGDSVALIDYEGQLSDLKKVVDQNKEYKATLESTGKAALDLITVQQQLAGVNQQYLDDLTKLKAALDKGAISQGEYVAVVSKLAKDTYTGSTAGKLFAQSLDAQAAAIERAAEAQSLRNQRDQEHIQFLKSSGQVDDEATIRAAAAAQVKDLNDQITAQQRLMGVERQRQVSAEQMAQKQAEINGKVANLRIQIDNAQKKRDEDLFLLEQQRYRQAVGNAADLIESEQAELASLRQQTQAQIDYNEQIGLSQTQVAALTAAHLEEAAARKDAESVTAEGLDLTGERAQRIRDEAAAIRERAAAVVDGAAKQQRYDQWKQAIDQYGQVFQQGFADMLNNGNAGWQSFTKSLVTTFKTSVVDQIYKMFARPIIVQLVGSFMGISPTAIAGEIASQPNAYGVTANSGSGVGSAISAAQVASTLYKAVSGGFSALGTTVADAVQAGMYQTGMTTQIASNGAFATGVGTAASYGAGVLGGHYIGNAIAGDYSINHGQAVTSIASVIGAVIGGPIGGIIGGAVGGLINRAFGHGSTEVQSQGLQGTLTASSLAGNSYQNLHQGGGWFTSDRNWKDTKAFTEQMVAQFTQGLAAIESTSSGFAKALGVSADWVSTYSKDFNLALTGDAAKDQQAITDFFSGIGDEIAKKLVPNLDQFSKTGETASATLERLAGDFEATDQVAQLIGKTAAEAFGTAGIESAKAREQLVSLAGSASTLTSQAQSYAQNYLTDSEKLAPVQKALDAAMASLGLSSIQTRDQFKAVVNSLDLTTEAGAKEFTSLMALADAFAQVHPAANDAATAVQNAADALQAIKDSAGTLVGDVDSAFSVLQKVVEREKTAVQTAIDAHTAAVSKLQSLSQSLHSTLNSMMSPDQQAMARTAGQAQIRAALAIAKAGGPLPDADSLKDALSAVSKTSTDQFKTYQDYLKDLYKTQNDIAALGQVTDDQLSVEQKALATAQDQLKSLDSVLTKAQDQIDVLKGQSTTLLSIDQAIQGLSTAIMAAQANPVVAATSTINKAYQSSLGRAPDAAGLAYWQQQAAAGVSPGDIQKAISTSPEATLQGMYQTMLHRSADAAGLNYWLTQLQHGVSWSDVGNALMNSAEANGKVPGFASGGDFGGGWRIVGENGPELEATGPARIFNAQQTSSLMSRLTSPASNNDALLVELRELRKTVEAQQRALDKIAHSTGRHADMFENSTAGGGPLLVEIA
jgi:tape measure domain-containing protein